MTGRAWLLISWVLVLAAALFAQAVVMLQGLRTEGRARWWALLPPAAPIVAWRAGRRGAPIVSVLLWVTYAVLRLLE